MKPLKEEMKTGQMVPGAEMGKLLRPCVIKIYANAGADFVFIQADGSLRAGHDVFDEF